MTSRSTVVRCHPTAGGRGHPGSTLWRAGRPSEITPSRVSGASGSSLTDAHDGEVAADRAVVHRGADSFRDGIEEWFTHAGIEATVRRVRAKQIDKAVC